MEISLASVVKNCVKRGGCVFLFGEKSLTAQLAGKLRIIMDLESDADKWIHQNPSDHVTPTLSSVIFNLETWDIERFPSNCHHVFGKAATEYLFKNPTAKIIWNGFPVFSFLLNALNFYMIPAGNDQVSMLVNHCNGSITNNIECAEFVIIAGPVSYLEWMRLYKFHRTLKGKVWLKKLNCHLCYDAKFENWKLWGEAKVLEGFACFIIPHLTTNNLIKKALQNGAIVYRFIKDNVTLIVPSGAVPSREHLKLADRCKCEMVTEFWLVKVLEIGHPVEKKNYYFKSAIQCQQDVSIIGTKYHLLMGKEKLEPNLVKDLQESGFCFTDQLIDADFIISDVIVLPESNVNRMITKFCIMDYLRGNEQKKCPYWHKPLPCRSMSWLSGSLWNIECDNDDEAEYWKLVLSSLGAIIRDGCNLTGSINTVGNNQTSEDNSYFNSEDMYRKLCCGKEQPISNEQQQLALDVSESEKKTQHHQLPILWPSCTEISAESALPKFQDLFRRKLYELGLLQLPLKLWVSKESEEICWESVAANPNGGFRFGKNNFLIGYSTACNGDSAKVQTRTICMGFVGFFQSFGLNGVVCTNQDGDLAIYFRTNDNVFKLFEIATLEMVAQMEGIRIWVTHFRIGMDTLGLLKKQAFHSTIAVPQVVCITENPNAASLELKTTLVWFIKEQDIVWITKKSIPVVVTECRTSRYFLIQRVLDGSAEKVKELNEEILRHNLQLSDEILCQESMEMSGYLPENWTTLDDSERKAFQRRATRAVTQTEGALEKDFKNLLLEAFSAYHFNFSKCKKYDYASPQFHALLKASLVDCYFLSGPTELSFDSDLEQYVVKCGGKTYYICKRGICSKGLLKSNEMCFKHKK